MHVSTTTAQTPKFRLLLPDYRRRGLLPLLVRESTPVSKITRKHNELSSACKAAVQLRDGSVRLQTGRGARGRSKSRIRCSNRHNTKRAGSGPLDRSANGRRETRCRHSADILAAANANVVWLEHRHAIVPAILECRFGRHRRCLLSTHARIRPLVGGRSHARMA